MQNQPKVIDSDGAEFYLGEYLQMLLEHWANRKRREKDTRELWDRILQLEAENETLRHHLSPKVDG